MTKVVFLHHKLFGNNQVVLVKLIHHHIFSFKNTMNKNCDELV